MYGPPTRITTKLTPMLHHTTPGGRSLNYVLPVGHVYDLSTLRIHVDAQHPDNPLPLPPFINPIATIPSPCECLIETLNVSVGDIQLNQINNYGQMFAALSRYTTRSDDFGRRMMTSAAGSRLQPHPDKRQEGTMQFIFSSFLGFLGSGALVDTNVRGAVAIDIMLADETVTGIQFEFLTYLTIDILPYGYGNDIIPYADYRTSLTPNLSQAPSGVIQTDNFEDHRLQYVLATMLELDYKDPSRAIDEVQDLGFTYAFKHSRMTIQHYWFEFDHHKFSHDIEYWEFLDRLKECFAAGGEPNALQLPLLLTRGADMQLSELCEHIFLAGESALGKDIPDGPIQVSFKTKYGHDPIKTNDCHVLMIAKYLCFI
jgi:hypothetical protein